MRNPRRRRWTRLACAFIALATCLPAAAQPPTPGNAADPTALDPARRLDPVSMSTLRTVRRRTPTGFLFAQPWEPRSFEPLAGKYWEVAGWEYDFSIEGGALFDSGDDDETRFQEYADWDDGGFVSWFDLDLFLPERGWYVDLNGGAVGREDQFYYGDLGIAGLFRLQGSFSSIPHVYANDAKSIFAGAGTDTLTLPPKGGRKQWLKRDQTDVQLDYRPIPKLNLFARYGYDNRDGERPWGGALSWPPSLAVETSEAINYDTHNVSAGIEFADERVQTNLAYNGSFFTNHNSGMSWENPLGAFPPENRFALAPDNSSNNVKGDVSIVLPWRGRITSTLSWTLMRQDDDLLAPTVNGAYPDWNTLAALPRDSADAEIEIFLYDVSVRFNPWEPLRLSGRFRLTDHDDKTNYDAFNPVTGSFGYPPLDGALGVQQCDPAPAVPCFANFRYRSIPTSYQKRLGEASVDYRLAGKTELGLRYEREEIHRDYRERDDTRENRGRVNLTSRDIAWATLRASYEYASRKGSSYNSNPYRSYFAASLPGFVGTPPPWALAQMRMYDLASRDQQKAELRANLLVREDMDIAVAAGYLDNDYDADFGLQNDKNVNANLDWGYQPSAKLGAHLFFGVEVIKRDFDTVRASIAGANPNFGVDRYPAGNRWGFETKQTNYAAGAGFNWTPFDRITLRVNYNFSWNKETSDYNFASTGALNPGLSATDAGSSFPDLRFKEHILETNLLISIIEHLGLRLYYRYQRSSIDNFHQQGLKMLAPPPAYLGHVDSDYQAHVYGVFVNLDF